MILVPEDLVTLRSLSNLASLSLDGLSKAHLGAANFSDDHFHRLVSGLQNLDTLSLHPYPSKVTSASRSIGEMLSTSRVLFYRWGVQCTRASGLRSAFVSKACVISSEMLPGSR
jgi:hypothetical protein